MSTDGSEKVGVLAVENVEADRVSFDKVTFCGDVARELGSFQGLGKLNTIVGFQI